MVDSEWIQLIQLLIGLFQLLILVLYPTEAIDNLYDNEWKFYGIQMMNNQNGLIRVYQQNIGYIDVYLKTSLWWWCWVRLGWAMAERIESTNPRFFFPIHTVGSKEICWENQNPQQMSQQTTFGSKYHND